MSKKIHYTAFGEEAVRGTQEVTTVGFIPTTEPVIPVMEFAEEKRQEWRGEDVAQGNLEMRRLHQQWAASYAFPMFTEAGTTAGMIGTLIKHFFGKATSTQNAATSQYFHMFYKIGDMFATAGLGTKAITAIPNFSQSATTKSKPYIGGRVTSLKFSQESGSMGMMEIEMIGQKVGATAAELGSQTYAAENLRLDYNNFTLYTGTVTRTGTGPDFTDFAFGSATTIKPDSVSITLNNQVIDNTKLEGLDHPNSSKDGELAGTLEFTIDFEDPAAGFSSVDDWEAWLSGAGSTNFFLQWDSGTQAGTGDNHSLGVDLPICQRLGGPPTFSKEDESKITLTYEILVDASTTLYAAGLALKNTATTV